MDHRWHWSRAKERTNENENNTTLQPIQNVWNCNESTLLSWITNAHITLESQGASEFASNTNKWQEKKNIGAAKQKNQIWAEVINWQKRVDGRQTATDKETKTASDGALMKTRKPTRFQWHVALIFHVLYQKCQVNTWYKGSVIRELTTDQLKQKSCYHKCNRGFCSTPRTKSNGTEKD